MVLRLVTFQVTEIESPPRAVSGATRLLAARSAYSRSVAVTSIDALLLASAVPPAFASMTVGWPNWFWSAKTVMRSSPAAAAPSGRLNEYERAAVALCASAATETAALISVWLVRVLTTTMRSA